MIKAKGLYWMNLLEEVKEKGLQDKLKSSIASLSPEDQAIFSKPIMAISWIDYGAMMRLLLEFHGGVDGLRRGSEEAAEKNFKGIFKFFISLMSPTFFVKKVPTIWSRYLDSGDVKIEWENPKHANVIVSNATGMPLHHEANIMPFLEKGLSICGARNLKSSHPKCIGRKDNCCIFKFQWE